MPSLANLFSRKKKGNRSDTQTTSASTDFDSIQSSPTTEYVTADKSLPSSPNGRNSLHHDSERREQPPSVYPSVAASSNKLRLPFTRKKASAATSNTSVATTSYGSYLDTPPRPSYLGRDSMSTASDDEATDMRRLRPPPSKSAIFAAYADPQGALSTRSLPAERTSRNEPHSPPPPVPPKKPTFFHWSKSTPSSPQATLRASEAPPVPPIPKVDMVASTSDSFNLKSFRHVMGPSPNASNTSLSVPIPRPRGTSITSESSQRISVAAFREAQARRSTADSPVQSYRAPSPMLTPLSNNSTSEPARGRPGPRPQKSLPGSLAKGVPHNPPKHRTSMAYSDSDESTSEGEDSDGSDGLHQNGGSKVQRERTITRNNNAISGLREPLKGRGTRSEIGHGSPAMSSTARKDFVPSPRSQSTHILMSQYPGTTGANQDDNSTNNGAVPRSHSSLGFNAAGSRPRASVSVSAISPSTAAKRASIVAAANSSPGSKRSHARHSSIPTVTSPKKQSSSSSSDSEDDAPLATLVPPRRPGSAMSSTSNLNASRSNVNLTLKPNANPTKPLIDINELTRGGRPTMPMKSTDGFTPGTTLIANRGITSSPTPMSLPSSPTHDSPITTSKTPPTHFVSPPSSPTKKFTSFGSKSTSASSSTLSNLTLSNPLRRETSPEQRRDALTERLTRVVKLKTDSGSSIGSSVPQSKSPSTSPGGTETTAVRVQTRETTSPPLKLQQSKRTSDAANENKFSPPDEDLARMLGATVNLISKNGESETESEDDEDEEADETDKEEQSIANRIAPIPIKERAPPPAFSVTSRPPLSKTRDDTGTDHNTLGARQRSSTLIPSSTSSSSFSTSTISQTKQNASRGHPMKAVNNNSNNKDESLSAVKPSSGGQRQRSTTMSSSAVPLVAPASAFPMPSKPFAGRRKSPASSTGDSSSGRVPFTPKDGSEIGSTTGSTSGREGGLRREGWSGGVSGLRAQGPNKHAKRRSVSFEEDLHDIKPPVKGTHKNTEDEERRMERRRSEAKAAIELGNVINGRGPVLDGDDDDDLPINQVLGGGRMSVMNPMMGMGPSYGSVPAVSPSWNMSGWPQSLPNSQMLSTPDPNFMVAHQQAMLYAKQAYQMAIAQQAMAAAGEEWERGSAIGGFSGGGSVYGGGSSASVIGSPFGMGMGMGMQSPGNGWSTGSTIFPPSTRSMYGGMSGTRSEYGGGGGGGGGGGWSSSRSSYGENFGPSNRFSKASVSQGKPVHGQRESGYFPPVPPIPPNNTSRESPRARTASQPATPSRGVRKAPPPSSWKAGA